MNEACRDQVEINSLIMLENKQGWLKRTGDTFKDGIARIANYQGPNGVATAASPTTEPDVPGITNRSPRTSKSITNAAARSDGPWVALIVILMMLLLAGGVLWSVNNPKPAATSASTPVVTPTPTKNGAPQQQDYIEFYKP
jgi:hypothetical protein